MFFDFLDRRDFEQLERTNFRFHGSYDYEQNEKMKTELFMNTHISLVSYAYDNILEYIWHFIKMRSSTKFT